MRAHHLHIGRESDWNDEKNVCLQRQTDVFERNYESLSCLPTCRLRGKSAVDVLILILILIATIAVDIFSIVFNTI